MKMRGERAGRLLSLAGLSCCIVAALGYAPVGGVEGASARVVTLESLLLTRRCSATACLRRCLAPSRSRMSFGRKSARRRAWKSGPSPRHPLHLPRQCR